MDLLWDIFYFAKRLIAWIPILWKDRDWDHTYFYTIMDFKLSRMEKESDTSIMAHINVGKQIRYARFLIARILKDEYDSEHYRQLEAKWGPLQMDFHEDPDSQGKWGTIDMYWPKARAAGKDDEVSELSRKIDSDADAIRQKDLDRLFRHMRKYVERWWI